MALRPSLREDQAGGDTCHLSNTDETLPDRRDYQITLKYKVGRLFDFSLNSYTTHLFFFFAPSPKKVH